MKMLWGMTLALLNSEMIETLNPILAVSVHLIVMLMMLVALIGLMRIYKMSPTDFKWMKYGTLISSLPCFGTHRLVTFMML